jgi:hypothetical protein
MRHRREDRDGATGVVTCQSHGTTPVASCGTTLRFTSAGRRDIRMGLRSRRGGLMAFREITVVQVKEALRRWMRGEGERTFAKGVGVDRKTASRYVASAMCLGVERFGGEEQLTEELIGEVVEAVRPHRTDGHGAAWRTLLKEEKQITQWVADGLTVVKIGILLERRGVVVPHRTLARFAVERCGAGRREDRRAHRDLPTGAHESLPTRVQTTWPPTPGVAGKFTIDQLVEVLNTPSPSDWPLESSYVSALSP